MLARSILFLFLLALFMAVSVEASPQLTYRFELVTEPALLVRIHVEFPGTSEGETEIAVAEEWGGVNTCGEDIVNVIGHNLAGDPLEITRPEPRRVHIRHKPGATIRVSYDIVENDYQSSQDQPTHRRPLVNANLFRMVGHVGLMLPQHIDNEILCDVRFEWTGFEDAGWRVVSSFSAGTGPLETSVSLNDLAHSLFVAGDITLLTRDIHGYPLTVIVASGLQLDPAEFADLCASVVGTEREFFSDFDHDYYLISLVPTGPPLPDGYSVSGSGLNNCFTLSVAPTTRLTNEDGSPRELVRILGHEMFHEWNGNIIKTESPEQLVYWFSEGFTDFYARRLLYRSGLMSIEGYVASVSATFANYATSPHVDASNTRIVDEFWNDYNMQKVPYYRGDIIAMILDESIRRTSNGKQSLDDVMRRLVHDGRKGQTLNTEKLLILLADFADSKTIAMVRDLIENGGMLELRSDMFAPCVEISPHDAFLFDLGFDMEATAKTWTVTGVGDGSAAHQAGLRNGMKLKGWSFQNGNAMREALIKVLVDGVATEIKYYPRGATVPSYKAVLVDKNAGCEQL